MDPQKTSKRDELHAQIQRQRWILVGLIVSGAALVVLAVVWPRIQSTGGTASPAADGIVAATPAALPKASGLSLGNDDAPVTIDVFEDFQCPACKYFTEEIETLVIANLVNTGKARYVFHVYPFLDGGTASDGGESDQAANASMCANEQGKFWEMHGTLFANWNGENQGAFSDIRLQAMAENIGLDMNAFDVCFKANKYKERIQADLDLGKQMGVSGTPTVFVNGIRAGQPRKIATYDEIAQAVEQATSK
jgi:protein-disulfide isomerase